MELFIWIGVFVVSLIALIKGADWLVENAEKIALALKISPFIIGITIVAFGTSTPELASAVISTLKGATEIAVANIIGSNTYNILLIIGLSAIVAKGLMVRRSLINIDLPLLASVTVLFGFTIWDGRIVWQEGILLLTAFLAYLFYTVSQRKKEIEEFFPEEAVSGEVSEIMPLRVKGRQESKKSEEKLSFKIFLFLILGILSLAVGANFLVNSVLKLAEILKIGVSVIVILAVAIGTTLPELMVSVRAAAKKKYEISLGNILGSNVFNLLLIGGVSAMIKPLLVDDVVFKIGFPVMAIATLLLVISGITRRISIWEGLMFILIYILFVVKLCGLF